MFVKKRFKRAAKDKGRRVRARTKSSSSQSTWVQGLRWAQRFNGRTNRETRALLSQDVRERSAVSVKQSHDVLA